MENKKIILSSERFKLMIDRLCYQIIENYDQVENLCLIGIQQRGAFVADRILKRMTAINPKFKSSYGKLDITFYRDDYRQSEKVLKAASTEINFLVDERPVILVDDVLYTGRTIHSAIAALQDFGRPQKVELLCIVDRRFNRHLPIKADYIGMSVDAVDDAYVKVALQEHDGQDEVIIFPAKIK